MRVDSIFIKKFENGIMGMTVSADGQPWRKFEMPIKDLKDKEFWSKLENKILETPFDPNERHRFKCPTCKSSKKTFMRSFKRMWFCGFCGSHLRLVDGNLELVCKR